MDVLNIIWTILVGLLVLTVLVVVHELGHFFVGRACGIKILEFGVGFGPKIWSKVKNGIRYSIRALPLGGFVQFLGEDEDVNDPDAFNNKPVWRRFLTVLAGPLTNIVFAFLLTVVILTAFGDNVPYIYEVVPGSTAEEAGLMAGDKIVEYDGQKMDFDMEFKMYEPDTTKESLSITVEREGETLSFDVPYYYDEELGTNRIGISEVPVREHFSFFEAIGLSFKWMVVVVKEMFAVLGDLIFHGQGASDLAGPVGTISIIGEAARSGFETILRIGTLLSINLGIVNILPLPALDGGRLVFLAIEGIRRKPIPRDKEGYIHFAGLILLFGLMILLTYNDIVRLINGG